MPVGGRNAWARDIIELDDRYVVTSTALDDTSGTLHVHVLSVNGEHLATHELTAPGDDADVCCLTAGSDGILVWGSVGLFGSSPAFLRFHLDDSLAPIGISNYPVDLELAFFRADNVVTYPDGGVLLFGYGREVPQFPHLWSAAFVKLNEEAAPVAFRIFTSGPDQLMTAQHGVYLGAEGNTLTAFMGHVSETEINGRTEFLRLDDALNVISGFPGPNIQNGWSLVHPDSVIGDQPYVHALSSGNFVISGSVGTIQSRWNAVIKTDSGGSLLATYLPPNTAALNTTPRLQAMAAAGMEQLHFCQVEGLQLGMSSSGDISLFMPTEPSRVRVIKLDTALNVMCAHVIDGHLDGRYYLPTRIRSTNDGGHVIIGASMEPGTLESSAIWVAKFPAEACATHVPERVAVQDHRVHPNPGNTSFVLHLSGVVQPGGRLFLHGPDGHRVRAVGVQGNRAVVEVGDLASGIYFYRIERADGSPWASGRWVKE